MNEVKGLLASKTFWGALVAIAAGVLAVTGHQFTAADQAQAVDDVAGIGAALGGLFAVYGRVVATAKIG